MAGKDKRKQPKISDFAASSATKNTRRREEMALQPGEQRSPAEGTRSNGGTDLERILAEIQLFRNDMSAKTDRLEIKMDLFQNRCNTMEERIKEMESRISNLEDSIPKLTATQTAHSISVKALEIGLDGLENRGRRNNVRLIGLPEGSEVGNHTEFFEKLLLEVLPKTNTTTFFSVVRAHRTFGPRPIPGAPPRAVLIRFLHFKDRDAILAAAREQGEVKYRSARLHFYQDLSITVQRERKRFDTAKQLLREKGIKYGMLFPARLRLEWDGKVLFFTNPKEVCDFVERNGVRSRITVDPELQGEI